MASKSIAETERWSAWQPIARHVTLQAIRAQKLRTLSEFAEAEIVIPDGPFKGQRFRRHRQPAHGLYFDAVDSGKWIEFYGLAPQQSGKTLSYALAPLMWHLFEHQETVIFGVPTMDIVRDKWEVDILPIIRASRYRDQLPEKGPGSRGGTPGLVTFRNGARLKFMTGGGDDEQRSAFTSRVLIVTEAEKFDERGGESLEDTKLEQLKGRVSNHGREARMYFECTVTIDTGVMWQGWQVGTASNVHIPCDSCGELVAPEREHLVGWEDAKTELQAMNSAAFSCPRCGVLWTDKARKAALQKAVVVHRGQTTDGDVIRGEPPETLTLGFRYSAATNVFADPGVIAVREWKRQFATPEQKESIDRTLSQWVFATPTEAPVQDVEPLDVRQLMHRQSDTPRGTVPAGSLITVGCDVRKTQIHWVAWAFFDEAKGPRLVDFGIEAVPSWEMTTEQAIMAAGVSLQDKFRSGWLQDGSDIVLPASQVLIDGGYLPDEVQAVVDLDDVWMSAKGFGTGKLKNTKYTQPKSDTSSAKVVESGFHFAEVKRDNHRNRWLVEADANLWKTRLHAMLSCDKAAPQAAHFCRVETPAELQGLCYELTAEKATEEWKPGTGLVQKWVQIRKQNHFLDAAYLGLVAKAVFDEQSLVRPRSVRTFQLPGGNK